MHNKIIIDPDLEARFPEVFVATVHASGLSSKRVEAVSARLLERGCEAARARLEGADDVTSIPAVRAWREAYRAAGVKPSKYRSSIESLMRRVLRGDCPTVIPLVDLYNGISMLHGVPLGAVDAERLGPGDVELRLCRPATDRFEPLGGSADDFPLLPSIPVYAAGGAILCWCFNCRDARPTALRTETKRAIFFTEGIVADQLPGATEAMEGLAQILESTGATTKLSITKGT